LRVRRFNRDSAPPRAIQKLAGHSELGTTERYMHLSRAALDAAIRLLDTLALRNLGEPVGRRSGPQ
jgi:integrase